MPLDLVWFELPNLDNYFNQILALSAILYIIYFFIQKHYLECNIKEEFTDKQVFWINRFLGIFRLLPIVLIIFAMYNIDNQSMIDGLRYNDCKLLINEMEQNYSYLNKYITRVP